MQLTKHITMGLLLTAGLAGQALAQPNPDVTIRSHSIHIDAGGNVDSVVLRITGGGSYSFNEAYDNASIDVLASDLELARNGDYYYEVSSIKYTGKTREVSGNGRPPGSEMRESTVKKVSGRFEVKNYSLVEHDRDEQELIGE